MRSIGVEGWKSLRNLLVVRKRAAGARVGSPTVSAVTGMGLLAVSTSSLAPVKVSAEGWG